MTMTNYSSYHQVKITFTIFLLFGSTRSETYLVGDSDGWTEFPDFTAWVTGKRFKIGDTLVFNYEPELHNVMQVSETAYDECIREPNLRVFQSGNDSVTLDKAGRLWYICSVQDHCENGQKLSINVVST